MNNIMKKIITFQLINLKKINIVKNSKKLTSIDLDKCFYHQNCLYNQIHKSALFHIF